ncbi:hypothetical protein WH221_11595 [Chryseobacterium culicis]|uniref:Uncharacterized protein n=1 Tax=Chryseobacterium culicis TaxID=680127 RepID=A0A2S9D286_CHRCI|nr:hypothetical protein [Chryseobacterium culicis]PRB86854.1 hypothetical protein CQ022_11575 [Chryseobacterium culicis]PRB92606.1 hypothetical protein CQ033_05245 [Chryseobacterium culicis]
MKTLLAIIFITVSHILVSGQSKNTVSCKITYLPTIRYENTSTKISKEQAQKIDSLIHLKSYKIAFSDNDLKMIKELYEKIDFQGNKIYKISESAFLTLLKEKEITIDFNSINSLSEKSITDLISSVIDGSPFTLTVSTKNNHLTFTNNFSGMPRVKELQKYLIFYSIYHELTFCKNDNELVKNYFWKERFNEKHYLFHGENGISII